MDSINKGLLSFRYFGWYSDTGHTELITRQTVNDLRHWHSVRGKPMVITEYGADTIAGMHQAWLPDGKI